MLVGVRAEITAVPDGERKLKGTAVSPSLAATGGNGDLGDAVWRRFAAAKRCRSFWADTSYFPLKNAGCRPAWRECFPYKRKGFGGSGC